MIQQMNNDVAGAFISPRNWTSRRRDKLHSSHRSKILIEELEFRGPGTKKKGGLSFLGSRFFPSQSTSTNTGQEKMDLGIAFDKHRGSWAVFLPSLSASFNGCILRGGKIVAFKKSKVRHIFFVPIKSYHNDRRALTLRYFSVRLRRHAATIS